jgi:hypothetical protein
MIRATLMCLLLAEPVLAAEAPAVIRRFALIAGTNDGGGDRVQLRYAATDARAVARVLAELGGVLPADELVLIEADRQGFNAGIDELRRRMTLAKGDAARIELLVYYSGHSDEEGLLLKGEHLRYTDLRKSLDTLPADVRIAILDSCSSGALTRRKGGKARPPFLVDESAEVRGHAFLTSSSEHEAAQESDRIGASFFTHYLLSGLRGAADVTADGRVTLSEAYQFAYAETLARTEKTQSGPQHAAYDIQLAGTGDLVMTDLRGTSAGLLLAEDVGGRMYVRDSENHLVAELYKPAGRLVELGLSPGDYEVTLEHQGRWFAATLTLVEGKRTTLATGALSAVEPEMTAMRGDGVPAELPQGSNETAVPKLQRVPIALGLVPGVTFPPGSEDTHQTLAFNLVYGRAAELEGFQLALGMNRVTGEARGFQVALGFNQVGGDAFGLQAAVGANDVGGSLNGIQTSVGFNRVGGTASGLQSAVGGNYVAGAMLGLQSSVGVNYVGGSMRGIQAAVFANSVSEEMVGLQAAVMVNYADRFKGAQVGIINVGGDSEGAQIGLVNVGGTIKGAQIGLVNVSDDVYAPIGLVNIVKNGENHLDLWTTTTEPYNLSLQLGSKHVYSIWGLHVIRPDLADRERIKWSPSLGIGGRVSRGALFASLDASAGSIQIFDDSGPDNLLTRLRATVGYRFADHFALFAGAAYNTYIGWDGEDEPQIDESPVVTFDDQTDHEGSTTIRRWPSLVLGLQL